MNRWLVLLTVGVVYAASQTISFDTDVAGRLPVGWSAGLTKAGGAPRWEVLRDPSAPSLPNVLAQVSQDRTAGRFPLAIYDAASIRNGMVSVRFKPVSEQVDEAAGLVWRYRDPNNYYIARANALENNVVLYKVQNGERTSIAPKDLPSRSYGVKHVVPKNTWSELMVTFSGGSAVVYLNQQRLFETADDTFPNAGKVGLWTKADSVTYFDDFRFVAK